MCGIAGCIQLQQNPAPTPALIVEMCDQLAHRGPDGEGFLFPDDENNRAFSAGLAQTRTEAILVHQQSHRNVWLGHRRLSIVDLSREAAQPMSEAQGKIWITFNGEIYNHSALRGELESLGYVFKTNHSDTEVILNAWLAWGEEMLHRLNGMFAFCIWDMENDNFLLVRDRMGIKPLYFTEVKGHFYFASEIKALLKVPDFDRKTNPQALHDILTFSAVAPPATLLKNCFKLGAGQLLRIRKGQVQNPVQWYEVLDHLEPKPLTDEITILEKIRELLKSSVNYRSQADVGYGAYLSGGLDSSANLAFLSRIEAKPVQAFTIGFTQDIKGYRNELPYARQVAKQFGAKLHEIHLNEEMFFDFAFKATWHLDEPTSDTASVPLYFLSKLAKDNGVTVCLGGEGSDELFGGYFHWRLSRDFEQFFVQNQVPFLPHIAQKALQLPWIRTKRVFYQDWIERIKRGERVFWGGTELLTEKKKRALIHPEFKRQLGGYTSYDSIEKYWNRFKKSAPNPDPLNWMSWLDLNFRLPELMLSRLDRMSMAASVEGRVPFLDHRMVEFALSLDPELKIKNNQEKYLFKKAMEPILPKEIIYRPKDGFTVPLFHLFEKGPLLSQISQAFDNFNADQQVFDPKSLAGFFKEDQGYRKWQILNLGIWWQNMQES